MYPARCANRSCSHEFDATHSGSVNCPACGTAVLIPDASATVVREAAGTPGLFAPTMTFGPTDPTTDGEQIPSPFAPTMTFSASDPTADGEPTPAPALSAAQLTVGPSEPTAGDLAVTRAGDGPSRSFPNSGPLRAIGRFEIRARLGEGAFGEVFRAYDPQLDREVALKVAKPGALDSPERVGRFLREARASANLRHPNIVPVFDSGHDGDRHYIASGFIDGRTLEAEIAGAAGSPPDPRWAATVVRALAEALAYAHKQGVVHRDVKPANVLVDRAGEPSLTDFGLAVRAGDADDSVKTQDGKILGTPAYMSPEQAAGRSAEATAASDQYALGVVLYEMTTGKRPFDGPIQLVLQQQVQSEPKRPRAENRSIPRDLETVILRCLEKDPKARYPDCQALADDLRRFLDGEPVQARRIGPLERFARWAKRNPTVAASVSFGVLALVLGAAVSVWQAGEAREQARAATRAAENEAAQKQFAEEKADEANREATRASAEKERANAERDRANVETKRAEEETRKAIQQARRAETVSAFMRDLFAASDPTGLTGSGLLPPGENGRNVTAAELLQRGARQIGDRLKDDPLTRAHLLDTIGEVSRALGLADQSFPLLTEALAIRRKELPADHPDIVAGVFHLANWHSEKGNFLEAEKLYEEALTAHRRRGALNTVEGAEVQRRLGVHLCSISDPRAGAAARIALATYEKLLGPRHRDTVICRITLAACLLDQGNYREALPHVSAGLEYLKSVGGDQKEGLVAAVLEYQGGLMMRNVGFHTQAEKKFRAAVELGSKALGANHIYIQLFRHELALELIQQKRLDEAEGLFKECLAVCRTTIGLEHPRSLVLLTTYSHLLALWGRHKEAYTLVAEGLRAIDQRYGKTVHWRSEALLLCAQRALLAGESKAARQHVAEVLELTAAPDLTPSTRRRDRLATLASVIDRLGDLEVSRKVYAAAFKHEQLAPDVETRWQLHHNFGIELARAGRYAEAEPHLSTAAQLYQKTPEIQSASASAYAYALLWQGRTAWALGRFPEAETAFRSSVAAYRKVDRDQAHAPGGRLLVLLAVQRRFGDLAPALEAYLAARTISATDRAWGNYFETVSRVLGGDQAAALAALASFEERFGASTVADVAVYRARAVCAAGPDAAVRTEIERARRALDAARSDALTLALAACYLRVGRPADAREALAKLAPQTGLAPFTVLRDTLKALTEYRTQPNTVNRERLAAAADRAEQFLRTFKVTNPDYSGYQASLLCDLALACAAIRDELHSTPVAPLPRASEPRG
jgi:tetratricopeptide (TPR) repeat protein/tRNA A-37 threonylcarbamoyl transferase component Bud32